MTYVFQFQLLLRMLVDKCLVCAYAQHATTYVLIPEGGISMKTNRKTEESTWVVLKVNLQIIVHHVHNTHLGGK